MLRRILFIVTVPCAAIIAFAAPALASQTLTVNFDSAHAPTGTHFVTGTPQPSCTVNATGDVTCPTQAFELAGVGNTNATANLSASYTATIDCRNHGGQVVESHSQTATATASTGTLSPKNGRLTVPSITAPRPSNQQFLSQATCPNPNWTPEIRAGTTPTLTSFTYTVSFVGFTPGAITITGP